LERVGESAYIENHRINTEEKMRNRGTLPAKSSPFHNPNLETQHEMKMEEIEINLDNAVKEKPGGTNGRPPGAKDKLPRAKKSKAAQILDAKKLYEDIYGPVIEQALVGLGLSNARQLTAEQRSYIENNVNEYYANMIVDENNQIIGNNPNRYNQWQQIFADLLKDLPNTTVAEANYLKAAAYVELSV
jgi:hypothetical protein